MACKDKVKVGIIGCGRFAREVHMKHLSKEDCIPELEVVAYADLIKERAEELYKNFGGEYYTNDTKEIFEDQSIQAILVFTNYNTHVPLCIEAIKAGKHVFVEKPLGKNVEEELELRDILSYHRDRKFMVGYCFRHNPVYEKVKSVIRNPVFSFAHVMTSGENTGEGYIRSNLCHALDMLCWLHRSRPIYLFAAGNSSKEVDKVGVTIRFENGSACCVIAGSESYAGKLPKWIYKILGKNGTNAEIIQNQEAHFYPLNGEEMPKNESYYYMGHVKELRLFGQSIIKDKKTPVGIDDGIRADFLIQKTLESLTDGQIKQIHFP